MKDPNIRTYNTGNVITWYEHLTAITPIEEAVFNTYAGLLNHSNVLDIGIGGGRTTRYLIDKCETYTGIDYSEGFVSKVKMLYPESDIRLMDARDLSSFEDNSFGFVNFSFNGIDYVNLSDRELILKEINRVLKPGGIFFFSTHNMLHSSFNKHPWLNSRDSIIIKLKTFIKLAPFYFKHLSQKKQEVYTPHYAIINDSAHHYGLMTFYTSLDFIEEQLQQARFSRSSFYSKKGKVNDPGQLDDWIFVTCEKSAI